MSEDRQNDSTQILRQKSERRGVLSVACLQKPQYLYLFHLVNFYSLLAYLLTRRGERREHKNLEKTFPKNSQFLLSNIMTSMVKEDWMRVFEITITIMIAFMMVLFDDTFQFRRNGFR